MATLDAQLGEGQFVLSVMSPLPHEGGWQRRKKLGGQNYGRSA